MSIALAYCLVVGLGVVVVNPSIGAASGGCVWQYPLINTISSRPILPSIVCVSRDSIRIEYSRSATKPTLP